MQPITAALAVSVLVGCSSGAGTDPAPEPAWVEPASYTHIDGSASELYAWEGRNVVLLTMSPDYDHAVMVRLLGAIDSLSAYYHSTAPRDPWGWSTYRGKNAIAEVGTTCGAGCGNIGGYGIELRSEYWHRLYEHMRDSGQVDQIIAYELARNFWLYDEKAGIRSGVVTTGYANFMRLISIDGAGLEMAPWGDMSETEFRTATDELLQTYLAGEYDWSNTIAVNRAVPNDHGLGASDLFAAMLFDLARRHYGDPVEFARAYWHTLDRQPDRTNDQDAVDNLARAACETVGADITGYLAGTLRWPVSDSVC